MTETKSTDAVVVTLQDIRALKYCAGGARAFFRRHGLSWSDFLAHGVSSEKLEETGDAMALRAIEVARGRR